jgi:peptidyl-prolyl cis-trans isomerase SurA
MKVLLTVLAAGSIFAGSRPVRAELANGIMSVVDDAVITYHEVTTLNEPTYEALVRQYRNEPDLLEKHLSQVRKDSLDTLVKRQLILHDFKTAGYSLPESVINDLVAERIKQDFGDRATLTKTLDARGMTLDKFRQQVRERFIVEQLRLKNVSSEIIISPHKIEAYYQGHRDEFKVEDEVKLRVIVLKASEDTNAPPAEKLAEEILTKLKEGASFAEMATLYSQGSQRAEGGAWKWYKKNELTKGLGDIANSITVGKFSGVFSRTSGDDYWVYLYEQGQPVVGRHYGVDSETKNEKLLEERKFSDASAFASLPPPQEFYLMLVEDTRPAHFSALSEVREEIEKNLLLGERNRLEDQWIERLRKKTFVRTFF